MIEESPPPALGLNRRIVVPMLDRTDAAPEKLLDGDQAVVLPPTKPGGEANGAANNDASPTGRLAISEAPGLGPRSEADRVRLLTWSDEVAIAGWEREDWLMENRLEFGTLAMLASAPFAGKSTLTCELIAAAARGEPLYGMPLKRSPILNLDYENRSRVIVDRIGRALGGEPGAIQDIYFRPDDPHRAPTRSYLEGLIEAVRERTGRREGLLIIDTLRSAYLGTIHENDALAMTGLLTDLRESARQTGWAYLLLHHDTKKGGSGGYSGTVAIAGVLDYLWHLGINRKTGITTLRIQGRASKVPDLEFRYDLATQRLVPYAVSKEGPDGPDRERMELLSLLPTEEFEAISSKAFAEVLSLKSYPKQSKSFAEGRLSRFWESGLVTRRGTGGRNSPYLYWVSDAGKALLSASESDQDLGDDEDCEGE